MPLTLRTTARLAGVAVARGALLLLVVGVVAAVGFGAQDALLTTRAADAGEAMTVTGDVSGVVIGGPAVPLTLTLHNAGGAPARVRTVRTAVTGSGTCAASYLRVGTWTGDVAVPARGTARVIVPVRLAAATPRACANATWGLAYTAR